MFMASCSKNEASQTNAEELATQQNITSKVMRIGRYTQGGGDNTISGTVIIFENGDYLKSVDYYKDSKSKFACALKEGDVVSYKKDSKGIELLRVESFAEEAK